MRALSQPLVHSEVLGNRCGIRAAPLPYLVTT
jgi:hypothetical protein